MSGTNVDTNYAELWSCWIDPLLKSLPDNRKTAYKTRFAFIRFHTSITLGKCLNQEGILYNDKFLFKLLNSEFWVLVFVEDFKVFSYSFWSLLRFVPRPVSGATEHRTSVFECSTMFAIFWTLKCSMFECSPIFKCSKVRMFGCSLIFECSNVQCSNVR